MTELLNSNSSPEEDLRTALATLGDTVSGGSGIFVDTILAGMNTNPTVSGVGDPSPDTASEV